MKKYIYVLFYISTVVLCCSFLSTLFGNGPSQKSIMAHEIANGLAKRFKKNYGLNFMGISEAAPEGKYKTIGFELSSNRILTKQQGREILLCCIQDILKAFNSHSKIQKYLINNPFEGKNIIINIYVEPPKKDVFYPNIFIFSYEWGNLAYYTTTPEKKYGYYTEERESHEEALEICNNLYRKQESLQGQSE